MNSFEGSLYSLLDSFISSDVGLIIFLFGGFVSCGICAIVLLMPWFRDVPHRYFAAAGVAIPVVVLLYAQAFNLLMRGRQTSIMLALSPIILAFLPTVFSAISTVRCESMTSRTRVIIVLSFVIITQIWATLVLWLATNHGFMGASC